VTGNSKGGMKYRGDLNLDDRFCTNVPNGESFIELHDRELSILEKPTDIEKSKPIVI
jgi:hypothetical protein